MFLVLRFIIKSKYLYLYLVSLSFKPDYYVGNIYKQGDNKAILVAYNVNSPVFVLPGFP